MKVAITGEGGFLGYHLTQYYKNKGWEVVSLGRNFAENLERAKECSFIIHAAGVNRAASDQEVYDANVELALILTNRLRELGMKMDIKFISSIQETNGSMYGNAKVKAKEILSTYCEESNTKFESYALPNLFGTHGKPNYNSFVNTFAYKIVNGTSLECKYNENKVNLCWVYDAIEVIDNQVKEFRLYQTTPKEVYFLLKGMYVKPYTHGEKNMFLSKLNEILNYYKQ